MEKRRVVGKMGFEVGVVRKCLVEQGRVYTVRGYGFEDGYYEGLVSVDGVGECWRVRVGEVVGKEDLERYVGLSGFDNLDDWWNKVVGFCGNRKKWLYLVHVAKGKRKTVLVTGGRDWENRNLIRKCLLKLKECGYGVLIHGGAKGADRIAGEEAKMLGLDVQVFYAEWGKLGKKAGIIRNSRMLDANPDLVLAFHTNLDQSVGTKHCVSEAKRRGAKVIVRNGMRPAF